MSPTPERLEAIGGREIEAVYQETTVEPRNRRTVISSFASFAADQVSEIAKKFARFERKAYELSGFTVDQFSREPLCLNPVVACKYNGNGEWYLCTGDQLVALLLEEGNNSVADFILKGGNQTVKYENCSPEKVLEEKKEEIKAGFIGVCKVLGDEGETADRIASVMGAQTSRMSNTAVIELCKKMADGLEKGKKG